MSSQVIFSGQSDKHVMKVSGTDRSVTSAPTFAEHLEFIWIMNQDPGDIVSYARDYVLSVAETFLELINKDLPFLQYFYMCEHTMPGYEHLPPMRSRGIGGIRIDGKLYLFDCGMGECHLTLLRLRPDGTGEEVKKIDCCDRKRIETDNLGVLKIYRRKKKLTWPDALPPLIKFIRQLPDDEVRIQVVWGKPKFMDLVRAYQRAGGEDDWAVEELANMGDEAKERLLEKLQDPKVQKYHHSIAWLLATVFPCIESKKAVEQLMARETNEIAKTVYSTLLEGTESRL